ncbi:hypothetical protein EAO27_13540 [Sphingopyxis sp. YF1]|nr:hypothetical protein EAO27_13540 [Sphingopyxis sp. YF1]
MILEAVDRMSGPAKRAAAGAKELTKGARQLAREGSPAARAIDKVSAAASRMRGRLGAGLTKVRQFAGRAGLKGLELAAKGAGWAIGTVIGKALRLTAVVAQLAVGAAAIGAGSLFGGMIRIGSTFEELELRLARVSGSAADAKRELRWLVDQKLPVPIEQLGEAFVQARKAGIDTTIDSLRALVDEAIGSKKELVAVVDAVKSAKNGDLGALEPFDIQTTRKNGRVILQWLDKTGKRMTKNVRDNARDIERALVGIFGERSKGAAEDYGRTLKGMWARLTGWWQRFQLKIADAGIYDKLKEKMEAVLGWLDRRLEDGSIDRWANSVSKKLEEIANWLGQFTEKDWAAFGADLWNIAKAVWSVAKAFADAVNWASKLINTQDRIKENGATTVVDGGPLFRIRRANEAPPKAPGKPPARLPRGPATPIPQRMLPGNSRSTPIAPQKVAVGGTMEVKLTPPPGWSATPTRMSTANPAVPVVFRGGANRGFG